MKAKFIIFIALLNYTLVLHSQERINNSWTSISQVGNIEEYQGAEFIVSGLLKKNPDNEMGKSSIWVGVFNEDNTTGFFKSIFKSSDLAEIIIV